MRWKRQSNKKQLAGCVSYWSCRNDANPVSVTFRGFLHNLTANGNNGNKSAPHRSTSRTYKKVFTSPLRLFTGPFYRGCHSGCTGECVGGLGSLHWGDYHPTTAGWSQVISPALAALSSNLADRIVKERFLMLLWVFAVIIYQKIISKNCPLLFIYFLIFFTSDNQSEWSWEEKVQLGHIWQCRWKRSGCASGVW